MIWFDFKSIALTKKPEHLFWFFYTKTSTEARFNLIRPLISKAFNSLEITSLDEWRSYAISLCVLNISRE